MEYTHQGMTYQEREDLKHFARRGVNLEETIIMISHWMRQEQCIPFSEYAANWAAAQTSADVSAMQKQWPLNGNQRIIDNCSDWQL